MSTGTWLNNLLHNSNNIVRRHLKILGSSRGFPSGISGKEPTCQCEILKRQVFNPWVRKIPWRRAWEAIPVFLPRESHGQRKKVGYSP